MADQLDLAGKTALITGSGRGLGLHYAKYLASAGADVIIHDINSQAAAAFGEAESGEAVAEQIRGLGRRSVFLAGDLADPEQARRVVEESIAAFGRLDIVVNNAGGDIGARTPRPNPNDGIDIDIEDIQAVIQRNLLSTMYMCKYAGAHMRERNQGKLINVGSGAAHVPTDVGIIYASAKAAISHYTKCLAEQLRPHGVNVNCIAPAATFTGRFRATRTVDSQEGLSRLQRIAEPEDMAKVVGFLASGQSDYLTGETIVCGK